MLEYAVRQEIRRRRWDELATAQAAHRVASDRFRLTVGESPSGIPYPDGSLLIQQVAKESKSALQRYMRALKRFTDFTLYGTIPDDSHPPD